MTDPDLLRSITAAYFNSNDETAPGQPSESVGANCLSPESMRHTSELQGGLQQLERNSMNMLQQEENWLQEQLQENMHQEPQKNLQLQKTAEFQEQQQQSSRSSTTPYWRIVEKIVQEKTDSKNEDTGVFPGTSNFVSPSTSYSVSPSTSYSTSSSTSYSTSPSTSYSTSPNTSFSTSSSSSYSTSPCTSNSVSPRSRRSPSIVNSLSSGCGSPDLQMQFEYNVDSQIESLPEAVDEESLVDTASRNYTSSNRQKHGQHSGSSGLKRSSSVNDTDSDPIPSTSGVRSTKRSSEFSRLALKTTRGNSQARIRVYRCRMCSYTVDNKYEYWRHNKTHIPSSKLLPCPKCPFGTPYRHHLEYHILGHLGAKPFKCDKCSYSCINRSMLNSHIKSHSSVYPYSCGNCAYVTKYCHSFKIHLRRYQHTPGVVLNADGTPNPSPTIDVYGNRRGPKPKYAKKKEDSQHDAQDQLNNEVMSALQTSFLSAQISDPSQMSSVHSMSPMLMQQMASDTAMTSNIDMEAFEQCISAFDAMDRLNAMFTRNAVNKKKEPVFNPEVIYNLATNPLLASVPLSLSFFGDNNEEIALRVNIFLDYVKSVNGDEIPESMFETLTPLFNFDPTEDTNDCTDNTEPSPLDLSMPSTPNPSELEQTHQSPISCCSKETGTGRRKGIAKKLHTQDMD